MPLLLQLAIMAIQVMVAGFLFGLGFALAFKVIK